MLSRRNDELYRLHLEAILTFTNGGHVLTQAQVREYTRREKDWVKKHIGMGREISAESLAYRMMEIKGGKT